MAAAVAVVWVLPAVLTRHPQIDDPAARHTAIAATRIGLGAMLAAIGAAAGLAYTARTYRLSREGHITDRYSKAVEQLGSDELEVRLGAIYALERLMRDSPADQPTVMEALAAYVRTHVPRASEVELLVQERRTAGQSRRPTPDVLERPAEDVQAVLSVLGRRRPVEGENPIDLQGTTLRGAKLSGAHLTGAQLDGADLTRAHLEEADLTRAHLEEADLTDAYLYRADLTGAWANGVNLTRAYLNAADLTNAWLMGADLTGAELMWRVNLTGAQLGGADLTRANLINANLTDAELSKANLTRAWLLGADLTDAELIDANLTDAELITANLTNFPFNTAELTDAVLIGADLTGAQLRRDALSEEQQAAAAHVDAIRWLDSD